ncbi:MAG: glycosyltransferase family 2 protein [Planctomycetes bacterium]|nr:glycosyltransferase family 2 protein [Planctomycetota bacterium]
MRTTQIELQGDAPAAARTAPLELSVVIPAYNEALNVPQVIRDSLATLAQAGRVDTTELLLINDGSSDGTREVCDRLAVEHPTVRVIHHGRNRGMGAGLLTGFTNARGRFVTFIPGDGEFKIDQSLALLEAANDAPLVLSDRQVPPEIAKQIRPPHREVLTLGYQILASLILGVDSRGARGLYLFRRDLLDEVELRTGEMHWEFYLHCRGAGRPVHRIHTVASPRLSGVSKVSNLRGVMRSLRDLIRVRLGRAR